MRWTLAALACFGLWLVAGPPRPASAQGTAVATLDPEDITALFARLSPEDRIGQLFIVAFLGDDAGPDSDIADLIRGGRVGGVVLQASSGNIDNKARPPGDVAGALLGPAAVARLTRDLQTLALDGGPGVPLFIAVDQEGDRGPLSHLREGYTALPSAMAIGATWDPANAAAVGAIVGQELAATGVNVLLGPVLDVLAEPRITQRGDIGVRAFGGDPYWVGRMGAAYIKGVHEGSGGRVATVAKHFPGHGASDRLPDTEVATISKSLEELRRVELPPFELVTAGPVASDPAITDGLMTSHIRYRGFQGNLRDTTPPISLDRVALQSVLQLPESPLAAWRSSGGLIVSDSLGVRAIRFYDDPSGEVFHHRDIARRALMAGNDVLVLAQFAPRNVWSLQRDNIADTLRYFAAEYRRDPAFARRVDDAAFRVLRRKAALYESWTPGEVAVDPASAASATGTAASAAVVRRVADEAVTILRRPEPFAPQGNDNIVIVADPRSLSCATERCGLPVPRWEGLGRLGPTLVEGIMIERFGAPGSGRLRREEITSVSFCELARALRPTGLAVPTDAAAPPPQDATDDGLGDCGPLDSAATLAALRNADWIVFAFTDLNPEAVANGDAVENFLRVAAGVLRPRTIRLAALSFGPPYPFEPTDFNKLDVFVAAYSKIPAAVEAAIDVLFGEGDAPGASPVTVEGADYDLATALEPDPQGRVPMALLQPASPDLDAPGPVVVAVGPVRDRNGHVVPDGTVVEVFQDLTTGEAAGPRGRGTTEQGVARVTVNAGAAGVTGVLILRAGANGTRWRDTLGLTVAAPTPQAAPTAAAEPDADPGPGPPSHLGIADLMMSLASVVVVGAAWVASPGWRRRSPQAQLRTVLLATGGGLLAYLLYGSVLLAGLGGRPSGLRHGDAAAVALFGALAASLLVAAIRRRR